MGKEPMHASDPPRWREVFQGRRGRLTAGLLLLEALIAVESLVVATIMPDVRRELGQVQLYGLAFSASPLATFASIPIAGTGRGSLWALARAAVHAAASSPSASSWRGWRPACRC